MSETTIGVNAQVGYKNFERKTLSGQFVVPPKVFRLRLGAQGGGCSGWSSPGGGGSFASGGRGGNAGNYIAAEFDVRPGDIINYVVGAGGVSSGVNNGQNGGDTYAKIGNKLLILAQGGDLNVSITTAVTTSMNFELLMGGTGGSTGSGGGSGLPGRLPSFTDKNGYSAQHPATDYNGFYVSMPNVGIAVSSGGGSGGSGVGAGGGGSSIFGPGGNAGNYGSPGQAAPASNYGAGGGGGGGTVINEFKLGGAGANGCLEIWY